MQALLSVMPKANAVSETASLIPQLDACPSGIVQINYEGRVEFANHAALDVLDIPSRAAIVDQPWNLVCPKSWRQPLAGFIERAFAGETAASELSWKSSDGKVRCSEIIATPLPSADERGRSVCLHIHDITRFRRIEADLKSLLERRENHSSSLNSQLEAESQRLSEAQSRLTQGEGVRLMDDFVANVIHDINNVLAVMSATCGLLRRSASEDFAKDIIAQAEQSIERGQQLVRRLLDFSRRGNDAPDLIDPKDLLLADRDLMQHLVGHSVKLAIAAEDAPWAILVQPSKLQSVVMNLLANARDAMPNGGEVRISLANVHASERLEEDANQDYVRIDVSDTGHGMTTEVLARAGEIFFTTKEHGKGTGLGLASAFQLAKESQGKVFIDSRLGEGTTVSLLFPRGAARSKAAIGP